MLLTRAVEADYPAIVALANWAYRGTGAGQSNDDATSWNQETGVVAGSRLDDSRLREELAAKPNGFLLTLRDKPEAELLGMVWLDPKYRLTGETEPFPYGDERFGKPLRDDLHFVVLEKEIS
jgi:hypothetical protein